MRQRRLGHEVHRFKKIIGEPAPRKLQDALGLRTHFILQVLLDDVDSPAVHSGFASLGGTYDRAQFLLESRRPFLVVVA